MHSWLGMIQRIPLIPSPKQGTPIHPRFESLILTHMLQSDTIQDEHTRSVGSQELGRANLWGCPTARYASNETYGSSGQPHGRESFGFAARSNADLERDQSLVSFAQIEPDVSFAALMQPHLQQSRDQANASPVVLLVQDTTDIDLSHRRHPSAAWDKSGTNEDGGFSCKRCWRCVPRRERCWGAWLRNPLCAFLLQRREQRYGRRKREERESDVWMRQVQTIGTPDPGSMWVHVGDRGADMFPFCGGMSGDPDPLSGASGPESACAAGRSRDQLFALCVHAPFRVRPAVHSRFPPDMGTKHVRPSCSLPLGR
jgi:hypothetical protein